MREVSQSSTGSYDQPPQPIPVKLPVFAIVVGAYEAMYDDCFAFLKLAAIPFGLLFYISFIELLAETGQVVGGALAVSILLEFTAVVLLSFLWCRRLVPPAERRHPSALRCFPWYLLCGLFLYLIVAALLFVWMFAAVSVWLWLIELISAASVLVQIGPALISVLGIALVFFMTARFLPVFPGVAIGTSVTFRAAWFAMEGNAWRVMAALLFAAAPVMLITLLLLSLVPTDVAVVSSLAIGVNALTQAAVWVVGLGASAGVAVSVFQSVRAHLPGARPLQLKLPGIT